MWRKSLTIVVLGFLLLLLLTGTVLASDPVARTDIQMTGQVTVDSSQQQAVLLLAADAADNSGWHLEAALNPGSVHSSGQSGEGGLVRALDLSGRFALVRPGQSQITGVASGQLDESGSGSLQLVNEADGGRLDATFSVNGAGGLQLDLGGPYLQSLGQSMASSSSAQPVDHTFWYVSRAAGLTAYLLLFVNVCLGLGISSGLLDVIIARWRVFDLHQFTGLLAFGFVALHVFALLGDQFTGFTVSQLLVPFASSYRPAWTALGVLALYLLLAVGVSSYCRRYIGRLAWRVIHYLSYGVYLLVLGHAVLSGTDTSEPWAGLLYLSTGSVVVVLTLWRLSRQEVQRRQESFT
jgi:DMSO/TMAO reductase YedYZ heme-binding membrane subunit